MKTENPTVFIYLEDMHPGITYCLEVISNISGWNVEWIDELPVNFEKKHLISYSKDFIEGVPLMQRSGFWENIKDYPLDKVENGSLSGLFPVYKGIISIDLPAFVFWSVARVEEYRAFHSDKYGRFRATDSWAYKNDLLGRPFVDEWVHLWQLKVCSLFSDLPLPKRHIRNKPSFDIDYPFLFRHQDLLKKLKVLSAAFLKGRWGLFRSLLDKEDPFDTFNFIIKTLKDKDRKAMFFLLVANSKLKEDTTLPIEHSAYQDIIRGLRDHGKIGIHPSIASHTEPGWLEDEKDRLEKVIGHRVDHSRSHYLKIQMPETYRKLIDTGIRHDHTMGFADFPGFRAGTAYPFYWYDVLKNRPTSLMIHPLLIMDVTLKFYLELSPEEAIEWIEKLAESMKTTGGDFSWLWHNSSFAHMFGWENWRKVFQKLLDS